MPHWTAALAFDGEFFYGYGNELTGEIRGNDNLIPATIKLF